jgi:hypothetical protein
VRAEIGVELQFLIGTMIELPRAALTADQIAEAAEFFSFGTNDLTQTTWGFSGDDVEASFFTTYLESGIFSISPFESIDPDGVGELVRIAVTKAAASVSPSSSGYAGSMAAIRIRCTSSTPPASTMSCARRSGFPSRAWKRVVPCRQSERTDVDHDAPIS